MIKRVPHDNNPQLPERALSPKINENLIIIIGYCTIHECVSINSINIMIACVNLLIRFNLCRQENVLGSNVAEKEMKEESIYFSKERLLIKLTVNTSLCAVYGTLKGTYF